MNNFDENKLPNIYKNAKEGKPLLGFRWVLVLLGFSLYFIEFFLRNAFPVALVAMVNSTTESTSGANHSADTCTPSWINTTSDAADQQETSGDYNWSTSQQGIILGAYFWGFVLTKLFASRICEIIGQRATVAMAIGTGGFLVVFAPIAASIHPYVLAANRFLIGACYGPLSSATQSLLSAWAPRSELSSMVTTVFSGGTLGGMLGLVVTGWLTDVFGWRMTFWLEGVLSFIFVPFWVILVRNSPRNHPWLSSYERRLLEENSHIKTKKTVPWLKILSSPYVYICILGHFARTWMDVILSIEGPSFFKYKMGLQLTTASYVCGGNYLSSVLFLLLFGRLSDFIIRRKYVSKIRARKIFHIIGTGGAALMLLGIIYAGCNTYVVIILWILVGGIAVGTACSYSVSIIDLAPNYTATVNGLMGFGNLGGGITPLVTSALLSQQNGWDKAFYLTSGLSLLSCFVYISFMTDEAQHWNFEKEEGKIKKGTA